MIDFVSTVMRLKYEMQKLRYEPKELRVDPETWMLVMRDWTTRDYVDIENRTFCGLTVVQEVDMGERPLPTPGTTRIDDALPTPRKFLCVGGQRGGPKGRWHYLEKSL